MYSASSALDRVAMEGDEALYQAVTALETTDSTIPTETGVVTITEETTSGTTTPVGTIPITIYTQDDLSSYQGR